MTGIIILTKNNDTDFFDCIESIKKYTHIPYKVYVGDTGSTKEIKERSKKLLKKLFDDNFKFIELPFYHFSKNHNTLISHYLDSGVDTLVFCNNDVKIVKDKTIDRLIGELHKNCKWIGTCGCRLLYENGKIQHDGMRMVLGTNKRLRHIGHNNINLDPSEVKYETPNLVIGNTFALCATLKSTYDKIGGISEKYSDAFQDVEYNLECLTMGLKNVFVETNFYAIHKESTTRKHTNKYAWRNDHKNLEEYIIRNYDELHKEL